MVMLTSLIENLQRAARNEDTYARLMKKSCASMVSLFLCSFQPPQRAFQVMIKSAASTEVLILDDFTCDFS